MCRNIRNNFSARGVRHWHRLGGGGVTISGGVPELWRYGTEGCGQWAWWGWAGVGLGDLTGLFQP